MIIALSGLSGTGKTTIKNLLAKQLTLRSYSMGDLRGKMAMERGVTIDELNAQGMTDASTDREVDEFQTTLGQTEDNFIIDGWLSWYFIPHAFKVQLTVDPTVAATRIYNAKKNEPGRDDEPDFSSIEETERILTDRVAQSEVRYQKWYGFSLKNDGKYDLVVDTTKRTPAEIISVILAAIPKNLDPQP